MFNNDVGSGKTSTIIFLLFLFSHFFPDIEIYSNVHVFNSSIDKFKWLKNRKDKSIKLFPNFHYTKHFILDYDKLEKSKKPKIFIIDDIKRVRNINGLLDLVCSMQRKINAHIFTTCQYRTHVKKEMREQVDYLIDVQINKHNFTTLMTLLDKNKKKLEQYTIKNLMIYMQYYDTNEIVPILNDLQLKRAIINSGIKSIDNLEQVINYVFGSNSQKFNSMYRNIRKEMCI